MIWQVLEQLATVLEGTLPKQMKFHRSDIFLYLSRLLDFVSIFQAKTGPSEADKGLLFQFFHVSAEWRIIAAGTVPFYSRGRRKSRKTHERLQPVSTRHVSMTKADSMDNALKRVMHLSTTVKLKIAHLGVCGCT